MKTILQALFEWVISYVAIIGALLTGKMVLADDSDLPTHLRRGNDL